jgi:hypothetical protein
MIPWCLVQNRSFQIKTKPKTNGSTMAPRASLPLFRQTFGASNIAMVPEGTRVVYMKVSARGQIMHRNCEESRNADVCKCACSFCVVQSSLDSHRFFCVFPWCDALARWFVSCVVAFSGKININFIFQHTAQISYFNFGHKINSRRRLKSTAVIPGYSPKPKT